MEGVLKLFAEMVTDIQGFNEEHFGIFNQDDKTELQDLWLNKARKNPNDFIALLSPEQKRIMTEWAITRVTSYNTIQLIEVLENFILFLKASNSPVYPIPEQEDPKKKKSKMKNFASSSFKKIIYKDFYV